MVEVLHGAALAGLLLSMVKGRIQGIHGYILSLVVNCQLTLGRENVLISVPGPLLIKLNTKNGEVTFFEINLFGKLYL